MPLPGYTLRQLKEAGYSIPQLRAAGAQPRQLQEAGFTHRQIRAALTAEARVESAAENGGAPKDLFAATRAAGEMKAAKGRFALPERVTIGLEGLDFDPPALVIAGPTSKRVYASTSLCCMRVQDCPRRQAIELLEHPRFDFFIIFGAARVRTERVDEPLLCADSQAISHLLPISSPSPLLLLICPHPRPLLLQ